VSAFVLRTYHDATKHSPASIYGGGHGLDWSNRPRSYKRYTTLPPMPPPEDLARLCLYSNGILRWRHGASGERYGFRAAPCTGALYHIELYLATAPRADLAPGLYHYSAHDRALVRLRAGDVRGALLAATAGFAPMASARTVVALTSTFWRNAWKYRERAYRHTYWDGGAVLANLLALAPKSSVAMGFVDAEVNRVLGIDGVTEAAIALIAIGEGAEASSDPGALADLAPPTEPLSPRVIRYAAIEDAHRASALASAAEVEAWRATAAAGSDVVATPIAPGKIEDVIRARRSTREFSGGPIMRDALERALAAATEPISGDSFAADLVAPFLIVNGVAGLDRGAYNGDLTPIRLGDARRAAGELALGQELGATAAANVYFLSDLEMVFERFGERGYRVAQIAGGVAGARLELAATSLGLGATGLTFFDDDVTRFFEPAASGRQVMYLAAIGARP
jgi:SagB-type dehydrogenase family enzyme